MTSRRRKSTLPAEPTTAEETARAAERALSLGLQALHATDAFWRQGLCLEAAEAVSSALEWARSEGGASAGLTSQERLLHPRTVIGHDLWQLLTCIGRGGYWAEGDPLPTWYIWLGGDADGLRALRPDLVTWARIWLGREVWTCPTCGREAYQGPARCACNSLRPPVRLDGRESS